MDDLGYDMSVVKSLINLEIPLNYAILPYLPYSKEIAQLVSINIFVDSFTTPKSIAYKLAQEMGVKSLRRNLFLDSTPDVNSIRQRLTTLTRWAQTQGAVLAICHPYLTTLMILKENLPKLTMKFRFVTVSELIRHKYLAADLNR